MSKKQWFVLLMLFLAYLLLGASIFYQIEAGIEREQLARARVERRNITEMLSMHCVPGDLLTQKYILAMLEDYCGKSFDGNSTDLPKWDFYNSFYFAYTVVSTIGYGNLAPTTTSGRILMIFYALLGIPMNGILLAQLGEFFGQGFVSAVAKYKEYKKNANNYSRKTLSALEKHRAGLAVQIFMYLMPGFIMFIFFPALVISYFENWDYDAAVYYAFVTLTTIGFGDFVAGQDNSKGSGPVFIVYKIFLICWISFGLGYIVMIMTFIARGMRSKKIARIEHKLALNLKHTQSKIWNEFNKELSYLRRVFNELQLSKVKRVYVDTYDYKTPLQQFPRSHSLPDLRKFKYGGVESPSPPPPRRRANSEVVPAEDKVARVVSETDLQRIDKRATFATHAMIQPAELLARLVNILGYIPPNPEDDDFTELPETGGGIAGFNEKEILASEAGPKSPAEPKWTIGGETFVRRPRAASEVRLHHWDNYPQSSEWTWSGAPASNRVQAMMAQARKSCPPGAKEAATKSRFLSKGLPKAVPKAVPKSLLPRWVRQLNSNNSGTPSGKKPSSSAVPDELDVEAGWSAIDRDPSSPPQVDFNDRHTYFTHTGAAEGSRHNLLEETSLADFLRALTAVQTHLESVPAELKPQGQQRKLGTASLTPPRFPSLFTIFSPLGGAAGTSGQQQQQQQADPVDRRLSLRNLEYPGNSTPARRTSNAAQHAASRFRRRFSLRPVLNFGSPPQYTPSTEQVAEHPQPPAYSAEPFVADSVRQPLVQMEGALGVSTPVSGVPLRPTPEIVTGLSPVVSRLQKPGILQRQFSRKMRQRVRALSLSDVNDHRPDRVIGVSPLVLSEAAEPRSSEAATSRPESGGKTVTIVSPGQTLHIKRKSSDTSAYLRPSGRHTRHISDLADLPRTATPGSVPGDEGGGPPDGDTPTTTELHRKDETAAARRPTRNNDASLMAILNESELFARKRSINYEGRPEPVEPGPRGNNPDISSAGRSRSIVPIESWVDCQTRKSLTSPSTTGSSKMVAGRQDEDLSKCDESDKREL